MSLFYELLFFFMTTKIFSALCMRTSTVICMLVVRTVHSTQIEHILTQNFRI